ncbi:MAG: DUF2804 domain-containing protein [Deltaproteobacteria bacterium]|nr:DUF2804 domain-containing protein [Deltaproteobacteria bacterium]
MTATTRPLPDHLPILDRPGASRVSEAVYAEREITAPVDLCDARGRLNPAAVGFARQPLFRANLSGHWPRKKRWNFWNWIGPDFVFSVTLADIDLTSFCSFTLTDFRDGAHWAGSSYGRPGRFDLPEQVEASVAFSGAGIEYANRIDGGDLAVRFGGRASDGTEIAADFAVHRPAGHESLNVVVPWSATRFQCNSKHAALPCEGEVRAGERRYALDPRTCFAVQDWGRGIWPHRSFWNWGVATGWAGDALLGVNFGAKWTTGTGSNENGILCNGRLHKIMEDLRWEYDASQWRKPWRVVAEHSGALDLVLEPVAAHTPKLDLGVIATGGVCAFGRWRGRVRVPGSEIAVDGLIGWAEEFAHRW